MLHEACRIMLSNIEKNMILGRVTEQWDTYLSAPAMNLQMFNKAVGKEGGHQLADSVDTLTTSVINASFPTASGFQRKNGKVSPRSMGDIWFRNLRQEWNPINVKTGLVGSEGQPNIVSLKKLLGGIINRTLDSYYLLMVKFEVNKREKRILHHVYLTDMLDWLSLPKEQYVITFDSGPGQTMLKAKQFFELLNGGFCPPRMSIREKVSRLMDLYEDGERRLRENRERDLKKFRSKYNAFLNDESPFQIDISRQVEFEIE